MSRTQSAFAGATGQHTCPRCNGFMVPAESLEESRVLSWRCVNCGEWVDPTVIVNRRVGPEGTVAVTRSRRRYQRVDGQLQSQFGD